MWRDILIILGTGLTVIMFLQLNSRRLSKYARTARGEITKRSLYQEAFLFTAIALTLFYIAVTIWKFETIVLANLLMYTALYIMLWCIVLTDVWKLSKKGERLLYVVALSVFLSLMVSGIILSDMLLWQKFVYPLGGAGIGFGLNRLLDYAGARLKGRRSSKEGNE